MKRLMAYLKCECRFLLAHKTILLIALVQPTLLYALMSLVFVHPTFDLQVSPPQNALETSFIAAMRQVGVESGVPYIHPILVPESERTNSRQYITLQTQDNHLLVTQQFGKIDSNLIKNLRNRVTAAALIFWQNELGEQAIHLEQKPLLPRDVPYIAYFGMALIPMGVFLASALTSAVITAHDFEAGTILESVLSPRKPWEGISVQYLRILAIGWLSVLINLLTVGWISGVWPRSLTAVFLPCAFLALIGGSVGYLAALFTRKALPSFVISLVLTLLSWLFGDAFGLAAGFSGWYERFSYFSPNRYVVELLFPDYYGHAAGNPLFAWIILLTLTLGIILLVFRTRRKIMLGALS